MIERAIARGEVSNDPAPDIDFVSSVATAMISYRVLMLRKPITQEFLIKIIDDLVLPALGLPRGA